MGTGAPGRPGGHKQMNAEEQRGHRVSITANTACRRSHEGTVVTRVLRDGWSDHGFCLHLVGDLRPDRCSCQVVAANCGQIVSSLPISGIVDERDTLCHVFGETVSWYLCGICGFTIDGGGGRLELIRQDTSAQHGSDPM